MEKRCFCQVTLVVCEDTVLLGFSLIGLFSAASVFLVVISLNCWMYENNRRSCFFAN